MDLDYGHYFSFLALLRRRAGDILVHGIAAASSWRDWPVTLAGRVWTLG